MAKLFDDPEYIQEQIDRKVAHFERIQREYDLLVSATQTPKWNYTYSAILTTDPIRNLKNYDMWLGLTIREIELHIERQHEYYIHTHGERFAPNGYYDHSEIKAMREYLTAIGLLPDGIQIKPADRYNRFEIIYTDFINSRRNLLGVPMSDNYEKMERAKEAHHKKLSKVCDVLWVSMGANTMSFIVVNVARPTGETNA